MRLRLISLGFGNVGRALAKMLAEKEAALAREHGLEVVFTGAVTRTAGAWISEEGIAPSTLEASGWPKGPIPAGARAVNADPKTLAATAPGDVVLELTSLSPKDGQPAIDHVRVALGAGRHVVTANKGPIAHALRELRALARERGVALRFESTVMDGTPLFGMAEASLPVTVISSFEGPLNSTSNFILDRMAKGASFEAALEEARRIGIAEANPSYDLEGWDASVKVSVIANALLGAELRPNDVVREGLGEAAMKQRAAAGGIVKQLAGATREGDRVRGFVRLARVAERSVFGALTGMEAALKLVTDTMGELTLVEGEGGPGQTAFGVIADLVAIYEE